MTDKQTPEVKTDATTTEARRERRAPAGHNNRQGARRNAKPVREAKKYEEIVINIDRVTRVVKGGRRFRFKALVAIGDGKTKVGVGVAKGADVQAAVAKATAVAEKNLITIPIENSTIPHEVETKVTGAQVLLKPAAPGTGIIAGGVVRSIIGLTGIKNLLSKSLGSTNKVNIAYATIEDLKLLVPKEKWHKIPAVKTAKTKKEEK
ncbi:MAG: 30S ribosomal protein S5 [Candidatus Saccharibacteria bacterium]|nr:30S ribosomal protein S5 [Candidatus Saccharibacteria bacterium]